MVSFVYYLFGWSLYSRFEHILLCLGFFEGIMALKIDFKKVSAKVSKKYPAPAINWRNKSTLVLIMIKREGKILYFTSENIFLYTQNSFVTIKR